MDDPKLPLLAGEFVSSSCCPNCGRDFSGGIAYIMGGASLLSKDHQDGHESERLQGFLNIGFHGIDPGMQDSTDAMLVDNVIGGQFDLNWCSIACMRSWLNRLLDQLERRLTIPGIDM